MPNDFTGTNVTKAQIAGLMRRINALQAAVGVKTIRVFPRKQSQYARSFEGVCKYGSYYYATGNNGIVKFNLDFEHVAHADFSGYDDFSNCRPGGDGYIYVLPNQQSSGTRYLFKIDADDLTLADSASVTLTAGSAGQMDLKNDTIYVVGGNQLLTYDLDLTYTGAATDTNCLGSIAVTSTGVYYRPKLVSSTWSISKRDGLGEISSFGSTGSGDGQFLGINSLFVDADSNLWVGDFGTDSGVSYSRIQKFNSSGTLLDVYGGKTSSHLISNLDDLYHDGTNLLGASKSSIVGIEVIGTQTEWYSYSIDSKATTGTPDAGVSVPADDSVSDLLCSEYLQDMRIAVEGVASRFENSVTSNKFDFRSGSADNLYYIAMGARTDYGATGGAKYIWTRPIESIGGSMCVNGDDGKVYKCRYQHSASSTNRPVSGVDYADYWVRSYSPIAADWINGRKYMPAGPLMSTLSIGYSSIVAASDGHNYACKDDHTAGATTEPGVGADWRQYWKRVEDTTTANAWTSGRRYYCNRAYDIDIGEIEACVSLLEASTLA